MTTLMDGKIELHHGDARKVLAIHEPHGTLITDPPYESTMHKAKGGRNVRTDGQRPLQALDFSSVEALRLEMMPLLKSVCEGWFIAFCTSEGIAPWRDAIEGAGLSYKRACFWYKPDAAPQFNGQGPGYAVECFVTAWNAPGVSRWNGGGRNNLFSYDTNSRDRHGTHPTEKPLALMSMLIKLFTQPGDLVIDPFMGSGTTGVAAIRAGRRFFGIELDPAYYGIAEQRISEALNQGDFFREEAPRMRQPSLDWREA